MKVFFGEILIILGLTFFVLDITRRNDSFWLYLIGIIMFWGGLELLIDAKLEKFREEIRKEIIEQRTEK